MTGCLLIFEKTFWHELKSEKLVCIWAPKIGFRKFFVPVQLFKAGHLSNLRNFPSRMLIQDRTSIREARVLTWYHDEVLKNTWTERRDGWNNNVNLLNVFFYLEIRGCKNYLGKTLWLAAGNKLKKRGLPWG